MCVAEGRGGVPPQPGCDQTLTHWCCGASTHAWLCWHDGASACPVKCGRSSCHPQTPAPEKPHQMILREREREEEEQQQEGQGQEVVWRRGINCTFVLCILWTLHFTDYMHFHSCYSRYRNESSYGWSDHWGLCQGRCWISLETFWPYQ